MRGIVRVSKSHCFVLYGTLQQDIPTSQSQCTLGSITLALGSNEDPTDILDVMDF